MIGLDVDVVLRVADANSLTTIPLKVCTKLTGHSGSSCGGVGKSTSAGRRRTDRMCRSDCEPVELRKDAVARIPVVVNAPRSFVAVEQIAQRLGLSAENRYAAIFKWHELPRPGEWEYCVCAPTVPTIGPREYYRRLDLISDPICDHSLRQFLRAVTPRMGCNLLPMFGTPGPNPITWNSARRKRSGTYQTRSSQTS